MTNKLLTLSFILALAFSMTSCEKDDPEDQNEEELITTVNYTLTPSDGSAAVVLSFKDLDGDGGDEPTITGGVLKANQTYAGSLDLLNESESTPESITDEIKEEDGDHQFFFSSTVSDLTFAYTDADPDGNPIGLTTAVTTGEAGSGAITVILRHEPNKSGTGVSDGDITNAGGETDIEVTFSIDVE